MAAGPLSPHPRAAAMAERVGHAAALAGMAAADGARVVAAVRNAFDQRAAELADAEHFAFLHPARNALIMLDDLRVADVSVVVAAATFDALHPALMPSPAQLVAGGEGGAAALSTEAADAVMPTDTGRGALLERLVACGTDARLIALVDRLDHMRHLHLDATADRAVLHGETADVYLPLAQHTHPLLARRFAWWVRTFERRFL